MKLLVAAAVAVAGLIAVPMDASAKERMFSHYVLFDLTDDTPENRAALIKAAHDDLRGHKGEKWFSTAEVAADMDRDVNVKDFDVALHIVFKDKAAHDAYQVSKRHDAFRAKSALWKGVRVIDTYVTP